MKTTAMILTAVLAASTVAQAQQVVHTPSITEQELSAQLDANQKWRLEQRERLISDGFCGSDHLAVEVASTCNWSVFGYPQMGSSGGSE